MTVTLSPAVVADTVVTAVVADTIVTAVVVVLSSSVPPVFVTLAGV